MYSVSFSFGVENIETMYDYAFCLTRWTYNLSNELCKHEGYVVGGFIKNDEAQIGVLCCQLWEISLHLKHYSCRIL